MTAAVVIPFRSTSDGWRSRALRYVLDRYAAEHPELPVVVGELDPGEQWSKGAAVARALDRTSADPVVIADADSFVLEPDVLRRAVDLVAAGTRWVVPHRVVHRLRQAETERLYGTPGARPRLGAVTRDTYIGPPGGGILVIGRDTLAAVGGFDRRFLGWGGEDVSIGWALETLVAPAHRLTGRLVHLWHPHPAPLLRGSDETEELAACYRSARGHPRRMALLTAGGTWEPLPPLDRPVRFRMKGNRRALRLYGSEVLRFRDGIYTTTDPDEVEALRRHPRVREEPDR